MLLICKQFLEQMSKSWEISANLCCCLIPTSGKVSFVFHLTEAECRPFQGLLTAKFKVDLPLQTCTRDNFLPGLSRSLLLAP